MKKPCAKCPFSRKCPPGALGGQPPSVYVGQGFGPFWLPCHMKAPKDKNGNFKYDTASFSNPQCVGAAMYRDLTDRAELMPEQIMKVPGDPELVFTSPEEFFAHHAKVPMEEARRILQAVPPALLMQMEFVRAL